MHFGLADWNKLSEPGDSMITIKSFDGGEFDGHLALPASGFGPGIVVLHEILNPNLPARRFE